MKRSEINDALRLARDVCEAYRFQLPKWAYWTPVNWEHCGPEVEEIRRRELGWFVTDFGLGDFQEQGTLGFVLRNQPRDAASGFGGYAERVYLVQTRQIFPMHLHAWKTADLVNRGGGDLVVQFFTATADGRRDESARTAILVNGIVYAIKPGGLVRLAPGDAVTVGPGVLHEFWAEKAGCLAGEVSSPGRFWEDVAFADSGPSQSRIEEDEPPLFLLNHEYPDFE